MNADRLIRVAAAATVAGLAGIAAAISYSHMRLLAQVHGQAGWHAHAFPLSVDGIEIVASLVLLADRRIGRKSGWLPWVALVIGTAGSLAANVATAGPGMISRIIAGWPALALLIAVKLLSGLAGQHTTSLRRAAVPSGSAGEQDTGDLPQPMAMPIASRRPQAAVPQAAIPPDPHTGLAARRTNPDTAAEAGTVPESPCVTYLLPAARAAWESLHHDGHRLTRDALAARLRGNGRPVSNARLTPLLKALRSESAISLPTNTNTAA